MIKRLLWGLLITSSAQAMVFDNRYLPLLLKPSTRKTDTSYYLRMQPFFMQADKAFADGFNLELPDISHSYNQAALEQSLTATGSGRFLRSDFAGQNNIAWGRRGRLDAQGLAFLYEQLVTPWLSVGINGMFAHVAMRHEFFLAEQNVTESNKKYLSIVKEKMHEELGVCPPLFSKTGFGDLDLYARLGFSWDYCYKMRKIDGGLRVGVLAPTAQERDISNPASIALGGNKHWGMYGQFEGDFELKEDLSVGLWLRASKRFSKTDCMRLPLCQEGKVDTETPEYGTLVGPVEVNPGWTFVFNPQVVLSHLRQGFGIKTYYTLIAHTRDTFCDVRVDPMYSSDLTRVEDTSSWGSEYVTIGAFYDFGKVREGLYPQASLYWDMPVDWLVAKRAARTQSVSLMLEFQF